MTKTVIREVEKVVGRDGLEYQIWAYDDYKFRETATGERRMEMVTTYVVQCVETGVIRTEGRYLRAIKKRLGVMR